VSMEFTPITGTSPLTTTFTWQVDCDYLAENFGARSYTVNLQVQDDTKNCGVTDLDGAKVVFNISDVPQPEFKPPNAFSPNGDNIGDEYFISSLPLNDCSDQFVNIIIYNRWGKSVFKSNDRNFHWDGLNVSASLYFYEINYENTKYKGTVHVFKE